MPERIQRKRTKGWKMPENTVSVTRPGQYGNPFVVGHWYKLGDGKGNLVWLRCYDEDTAKRTGYTKMETVQQCIEWYKELLRLYPLSANKINELRGKNLACWCPPGKPCHADVLLEIVNKNEFESALTKEHVDEMCYGDLNTFTKEAGENDADDIYDAVRFKSSHTPPDQ